MAEREQTIEDLRHRLDSEAEERRRLTARLTDQRENAAPATPVDPAPLQDQRLRRRWWPWNRS